LLFCMAVLNMTRTFNATIITTTKKITHTLAVAVVKTNTVAVAITNLKIEGQCPSFFIC